jgi:hypothetical protein
MYRKSIFVLLGIRNPYAFNKYYIKIVNNHTTLIQRSSENTLNLNFFGIRDKHPGSATLEEKKCKIKLLWWLTGG